MAIELKGFLTKESFAAQIEEKVLTEGCTYFQAVIEYAEDHDRSPEELLPFMDKIILDKVKKSATDLGLVTTDEIDLETLGV